ncbi:MULTISPECIES: hypothetical protein [Rhizobium]|uniref:hypothetical protein n=1 Tax=Rhizobium TaxID=379 RepID=UPI001C8FDCDF|nr:MULTISPECIES: hypothetical protein [Rhizobium]MBY3048219.1 hypothetical protein [Rhizobium laguerreae]
MLERRNAVEHWLQIEVAATYDAYKADPTKAKPRDEVWKRLEARMDKIDQKER